MTFNPLANFDGRMIRGFVDMGDRFLVAQAFPRGQNPMHEKKLPLLLSHYSSFSYAKGHLDFVKGDKLAAIIDLKKSVHVEKLLEMASPNSSYLLFVAFAQNKKKISLTRDRFLAEAIRQYIGRETGWKPATGETVHSSLELHYGELYLRIRYNGELIKEKLAIFENCLDTALSSTTSLSVYASERYQVELQISL